MPGPQALPITLSPPQQAVLERLLHQPSCPHALARRVKIVLAAATGQRNEQIAHHLGCAPTTVRLWRARWSAAAGQLAAAEVDERALRTVIAESLADAPRPGAPPTFTAEQIVQIVALACPWPADASRPVDAWTPREVAAEAQKRQIVSSISARSVGRFLKTSRSQAAPEPLLAQHDRA